MHLGLMLIFIDYLYLNVQLNKIVWIVIKDNLSVSSLFINHFNKLLYLIYLARSFINMHVFHQGKYFDRILIKHLVF